jgi:hypothetical protein
MAESRTYSCRYESLLAVLAIIDDEPLPGPLPACDRPAVFATHVDRGGNGQAGVIYTRQCEHHDRLTRAVRGYDRSVRLAAPKPDSSP